MTQLTLDQAMQIALQHHQAGRPPQAEQLYCQIASAYRMMWKRWCDGRPRQQ